MRGALRLSGRNSRRNHAFNGRRSQFSGQRRAWSPSAVIDGLSAGAMGLTITNTRASAQTVTDHDGIYRQAKNNELCWDGLRRVENLLARSTTGAGSEVSGGAIPTAWFWTPNSATISAASYGTFSDGAEYVEYTVTNTSGSTRYPYFRFVYAVNDIPALVGEKMAFRIRGAITAASGGAFVQYCTWTYSSVPAYIAQQTATLSTANQTLTDNTYATGTPLTLAGAGTAFVLPHLICTIPNGASLTIRIAKVQLQRVQGASNLVCGEYVNAATVHNAVAAGVKYFPTTNGNSVSSGVLVEADGTAISNTWTMLSLPRAQTNYAPFSEDLSNVTYWARSGVSAPTADPTYLGPDATGSMWRIIEDTSTGYHGVAGPASGGTTGTTWTTSCVIAAAGTAYGVRVANGSFGGGNYAYVDIRLSDMTIVGSGGVGTTTFRNAYIERVGSTSLYRVMLTCTFAGATIGEVKIFNLQSSGVASYTGNGSNYCIAGFGHLSPSDHVGPYIPNKSTGTTTIAVNDPTGILPTMFAANGNMTAVIKYKPFYNPAATWKSELYLGVVIGSSVSNDFLLVNYGASTTAQIRAQKKAAGVIYDIGATATGNRLQTTGVCTGLTGSALSTSLNGAAVVTNSNTVLPANTAVFSIGDLAGGLVRLEFWPRAMSDSEMRARSTP